MQVNSSTLAFHAAHFAEDSVQMRERIEIRRAMPSVAAGDEMAMLQDSADMTDPKTLLARWLYEYFTGRKAPLIQTPGRGAPAAPAAARSPGHGWGVSYTRQEVRRQSESTAFTAEGTATLKSGATVSFSLNLTMNRESTQATSLTFRAGEMTDPLAVNLDGAGVGLSGERTAFDLNGDGVDELISTLAEGSAWLAQDVNGNGAIDSGRELFGPASGDGFRELAALDGDHNGWIDEGDAAYTRMGIWRDGQFTSLEDAGIGALAAASIATPFTLKEGSDVLGQIRESGVYLREDGAPGAIQEVDLKV